MATFEDRMDMLEDNLRHKMDVLTGFAEDSVKAKKCEEMFKFFDKNGSGEIDMEEFFIAMTQLNFVGVQAEIEGLFNRYDDDCSGTLNFREFAQKLFGLLPSHTLDRNSRNVVERIRAAVLARAGGSGVHALTRVLRSMDQDGSKTLDQEELKAGLEQLGCELNDGDEMRTVMRHFDKDGSGRVSIEEFLRGIKTGMSYERKLLVKEAFSRLDRTGDGVVAADDIMAAYSFEHHPAVQAGAMSEEDAALEFLSVFEGNSEHKDGVVTWSEFLDYYRGLSVAIDDDDYFELMMRNSWRISGGEGAAANTANRRVLVTHSDGSEEVVEIINDLGCGDSMEEIRRRLEEQGVEDIYKVQL